MRIVPTFAIDFIGTVAINRGHHACGSPDIMAIFVGTMAF